MHFSKPGIKIIVEFLLHISKIGHVTETKIELDRTIHQELFDKFNSFTSIYSRIHIFVSISNET